jgi:hypothetical protein
MPRQKRAVKQEKEKREEEEAEEEAEEEEEEEPAKEVSKEDPYRAMREGINSSKCKGRIAASTHLDYISLT